MSLAESSPTGCMEHCGLNNDSNLRTEALRLLQVESTTYQHVADARLSVVLLFNRKQGEALAAKDWHFCPLRWTQVWTLAYNLRPTINYWEFSLRICSHQSGWFPHRKQVSPQKHQIKIQLLCTRREIVNIYSGFSISQNKFGPKTCATSQISKSMSFR